jgi:uncharacterized protein (DUF58 family)
MIPKEILDKVRRIHIYTSHVVNNVFAGEYESVFKGRGMEFDEVREYQPGDEVRSIDWNVTARMGHPYVKRFVEERELTVMLIVDMSASGSFGTVNRTKNELAAELGAVLAFSAIRNKDKVGLILFTDKVEKFIPPRKGVRHVLRVIRELLYFKPEGTATDISCALEYLNKVTIRKTVTFLISDFLTAGYEKALQIANKRHDVIAVMVDDPREKEIPPVGIVELEDSETGEKILIDTNDTSVRKEYVLLNEKKLQNVITKFKEMHVDYISISTEKSYIEPLMKFFRMREKRSR